MGCNKSAHGLNLGLWEAFGKLWEALCAFWTLGPCVKMTRRGYLMRETPAAFPLGGSYV